VYKRQVFGDVYLAAGVDSLTNGGYIDGRVDLGADDDTYTGKGGTVTGVIALGDGDDTGSGGSGADSFDGGSGKDSIRGGGGEDEILGGLDNDNLRGGSGEDTLSGQNGNDVLRGGKGDDEIVGGKGKDTIDGGSGDDEITGGIGRDLMSGGSGNDTFVFSATSQSGTGSNRDVITDFGVGSDKIDLTGFGGLTFIGTANFSGTGEEVSAKVNNSGNTIVSIDADGNGSTDSQIELRSLGGGVTIDDFLL